MQRRLLTKILVFIIAAAILSLPVFALQDELSEIESKAKDALSKLKIESIIDFLTSNISLFSKSLFSNFVICFAVIMAATLFSIIKTGFGTNENVFELISCCVVIIIVFSPLTKCFIKAIEHIEAVCGFMISLIPTCVVLHTASGNSLSASLMSTSTMSVITLIQTVSVSLILPLIKASLSIETANIICKNPNISGISAILKSISMWTIGLCFTLFSGFLSLSSLLQAGADNLAMKGLKYGAAKLIPIAGGMVSESMKTVITSVGYIKSVTGISGIIFIIYAIIPPLCFILMTKLYLTLLSITSNLTHSGLISNFLKASVSALNLLLALLLSCSVSIIIILSIFIKSTVSV